MLIDIIGSNNESNFLYSHVILLFIGDHDMVGCLHKINCKKFVPCSIICRDYGKYDPESLCIDIKNSNINLTDQFENVNNAWGPFYATLLDIFNKHVPVIKRKVQGKPSLCFTSELKRKMNNIRNASENVKKM